MSGPKLQQPVYKVYEVSEYLYSLSGRYQGLLVISTKPWLTWISIFQPGYHPQRTIIVDEQVESPETLTIRLEEEAARNGGDLSGACPPGLLPMSAYKPQPPQLHGMSAVSEDRRSRHTPDRPRLV